MSYYYIVVIGCVLAALVFGVAGYCYVPQPDAAGNWQVRAAAFQGIIREVVKTSLLGSGAGWLTSIYADELDGYPNLRAALLATLLVSLGAAIVGFWTSVMADARTDPATNTTTIRYRYWFFVRGALIGTTLAVLATLLLGAISFAQSKSGV